MSFTPDTKLQEAAIQDAENAIKFAWEHFKIQLDWSDESINKVEKILDALHRQAIKDKPTETQIFSFARPFGSYIGEVYRRNYGANWGMCTIEKQTFPGLSCTTNGKQFWPMDKSSKTN